MTTGWPTESVANCLERISLGTFPKLQTREYRPEGKYPVVDQGLSSISGWTNDDQGLITSILPVVVFGDHTRVFKYVDFPFVRGADGTQILKPRSDIHPIFFYYACRAIELPSRGYNRHFKALKEKEIPIPSHEEQVGIAYVLQQIDEAITVQIREVDVCDDSKRATMRELFTRGLRGEAQKETEIGPLPGSWGVGQLGQVADVVSTRMTYTELRDAPQAIGKDTVMVLGIKVADMNLPGNEVELQSAILGKKVNKDIAKKRCAPPRTIIFPKRGAAIATNKKRISTEWTVFDPNVIGVLARDELSQDFLFQWFQMFDLRTITDLGPTPQLNKKNLLPLQVPIPPTLYEQHDIVAILDIMDRKIDLHRRKRGVLSDLFKALLHKLMTGEISVSDLDLPPLPSVIADTTTGRDTTNE